MFHVSGMIRKATNLITPAEDEHAANNGETYGGPGQP